MASRLRAVVWGCLILLLLAPAAAQPTKRHTTKSDSLAAAVPPSAGLFIELNRIGARQSSPRARNAYRLYDLLMGPPESGDGVPDWRPMVLSSLGLNPGEGFRELLSHQFAVAAPSFKKLSEGIIVVRLTKNDNLIDEVFAPDDVRTIGGKGKVIVYRTHTRLSAATNGDLLVISQRNYTGSLYHQIVRQMRDGRGASLADDPDFQNQIRDLPAHRDGTVYVKFNAADADPDSGSLFPTALTRLAIGVYFKTDHVDFAFRATRTQARSSQARPAVSIHRLKQLPLTTLSAWCTEFDVHQVFRMLVERRIDDSTPAYVKRLVEILDVDQFKKSLVDNLGPGAIITWDQHLGPGPEIPQIAVLLESRDALQCATALAEVVQTVVTWFDIKNRAKPGQRLRLTRADYLGTTIHEVGLPWAPPMSGLTTATTMSISPAFAAVGDSFVIALSADHIRNIVDAQIGLAPTLMSLRPPSSFDRDSNPAVMVGVAQPALIAQTVEHWLNDPDGMVAPWLNRALGGQPPVVAGSGPSPRLGIGTQPGQQPGTVLVVRVYRNGPTYGRLLPGDHILGVNGSLLSLTGPTDQLRRLVRDTTPAGKWVFRVEREGRHLDIPVPSTIPALSVTDPSGALHQLQRMFRRVDFGSIRAVQSAPDRLSADLTLRFSSDRSRG